MSNSVHCTFLQTRSFSLHPSNTDAAHNRRLKLTLKSNRKNLSTVKPLKLAISISRPPAHLAAFLWNRLNHIKLYVANFLYFGHPYILQLVHVLHFVLYISTHLFWPSMVKPCSKYSKYHVVFCACWFNIRTLKFKLLRN
jgi:hypothetical protein